MAVPSLAALLHEQLCAALPDVEFDPQVRPSDHADFQANGLLPLAARLGRRPRELAAAVASTVEGAAVAGPGFVNLMVPDVLLCRQLARRLADPRLGVDTPEAGRRTVLDYSQPNIAKALHVGHLRSTVIGDALARLLGFLGGEVVRRNHLGDWGTQFGMLIEYTLCSGTTDYLAARARFDADPDFAERSRRRVVQLQAGEPVATELWRRMVQESTVEFGALYERLGVLLEPADAVGESFYNPLLPAVAQELQDAGLARVSDGALCVFLPDRPAPLIVRKRDGGFGYAATDLAAVRHRVETLGATRLVYVVDARQALHFAMVFGTARLAGWLPSTVEAVHVPFGTVLGADGRPFKTREGTTVPLSTLLDEAVARAAAVVAQKSPGLGAAELAQRAAEVGIGAVKYADLVNHRGRDYVFDLDRMLSLSGNTAVYLQYAHARVCSILARAGEPGAVTGAALTPPERRLILWLDRFGEVVVAAAAAYEPHQLAGYLYGLAQALTAFYGACPVLTAPPSVRQQRLALCRLTARTLATGLGLLGIAAPERL